MTKEQYYSLKKGDIVKWQDTGSNCIVMHFDTTDYPNPSGAEPQQNPNPSENLCVIFCEDNYRVIGHRKEFGYISKKKLNKNKTSIV